MWVRIYLFRNVTTWTILSFHKSTHLFRFLRCNHHLTSRCSTEAGLWCIMAHLISEIWLPWIVSFLRYCQTLLRWSLWIYRVLFMGGTSCIIIGFSFATEFGCEFVQVSCLRSISLSFVKGDHQQFCRCWLLVSCFFYMLATMKNTRQGNLFSPQRRSMIFLQVTYTSFYGSRVSLNTFSDDSHHHVHT